VEILVLVEMLVLVLHLTYVQLWRRLVLVPDCVLSCRIVSFRLVEKGSVGGEVGS
jgi:TctA family transporter